MTEFTDKAILALPILPQVVAQTVASLNVMLGAMAISLKSNICNLVKTVKNHRRFNEVMAACRVVLDDFDAVAHRLLSTQTKWNEALGRARQQADEDNRKFTVLSKLNALVSVKSEETVDEFDAIVNEYITRS